MATTLLNPDFTRQIVLNVKPKKYKFFLELLNSFDFVEIAEKTDGDSREDIITNLKQTAKDLKLLKEGKLETRPARELLKEL